MAARTLLLFASLGLALPAAAQAPHRLRVVNDSNVPVDQLFAFAPGRHRDLLGKVRATFSTPQDERDRLAAKTIAPRQATLIDFGSDRRCLFDLRAILEDGRTYEAPGFDICRQGEWRVTSGVER